ncbi:MAG: hydrogenase [Desulfobacterales bacterium]|nr:hydrogenase [Desulfobacterales bacterium]
MTVFLAALALIVAGGAAAWAAGRRPWASALGAATGALGSAAALLVAAEAALSGRLCDLRLAWPLPFGSFHVGFDGLSAFFAAVTALVCGLAAVYGVAYLRPHAARRPLGSTWFAFNLLTASMLVVTVARDAVLFLVAWELMSLTSFFLVMFEGERPETVSAGWTYLVATHLGTAFLLALFVLLGRDAADMDFDRLNVSSTDAAAVCFVLALVGFGTKAGFVPLHVWLPRAHPAAPSHVSAVMSGVMIKTGIYGLLRVLTFLGPPEPWWGWTLVAVGAVSGVLGVLLALAQHDLKRLLAYHSVENIGIIAIGLGLGLAGLAAGNAALAVLGTLGGLMHVLNHAVFKSLLFFGAGAVLHATGTRDLERLGGLIHRMGTTGASFLIGSAAISGLPPLNGFVSEFLIYAGAFGWLAGHPGSGAAGLPAIVAILALAMIGGLAAACFAKAFGVAFLGEPRSAAAAGAHECPAGMRLPMVALAALCMAIGLLGALAISAAIPAAAVVLPGVDVAGACADARGWLWHLGGAFGLLVALTAGAAAVRRRLLAGRTVATAATWDCGYAAPTARMQYTASSFAAPLIGSFRLILRPATRVQAPEGLFPKAASLHTRIEDPFEGRLFAPLFRQVRDLAARLHWLQAGPNQLYVLYVAAAVLALLLWALR